MRVGDFGVEVVPVNGKGEVGVRELESGHVLARPGTVYLLRLRNFGPLRCVAAVTIDGTSVTAGGLVLEPWSTTQLERPVDATESGRFTVIAEGDERVFGPDGGRDNPDLGLVQVNFRRELPSERAQHSARPLPAFPTLPMPDASPNAPRVPLPPGRPMAPPEWNPPGFTASARPAHPQIISRTMSLLDKVEHQPTIDIGDVVERAAGTGLTGHSTQSFVPVTVGPLEAEATVIRLRIVVGTEEALSAPRALPETEHAPARPAARP